MGIITQALTAFPISAARRTAPDAGANQMSAAAVLQKHRRVGKSNVQLYRNWADHGEFVRTAIDIRKGQLERAEYDLVPFDIEARPPDTGLVKRQMEILSKPNPGTPSFGSYVSAVAEDILVLDAGATEKERMLKGEIAHLWAADGGRIKVDRFWQGDPKDPRYYWIVDPTKETPLYNDDLIYTMIHDRSYSPIGLSYLEVLKAAIDAELTGSLFNSRAVTQATPDGIMDLGENARPDQVEAFKSYFMSEITGGVSGMLSFWGGTKGAKFIPFRPSNHEMQYMEWLRYNAIKVAAVFQISVQDLQLLHDVNKSTGEVQQQNTEDRGFKTLAGRVQDHLTAEFCWDPAFGGRKNNIAFRFRNVSIRTSKDLAEVHKLSLAGMPSTTINEARRDIGLPPIGDPKDQTNPFNKLMANTPVGLVLLDRIPTADDYLEARKKAQEAPPPKPGGDEPAKVKQLEKDLALLQSVDLRLATGREDAATAMERVAEALVANQRDSQSTLLKIAEVMASRPIEVKTSIEPGAMQVHVDVPEQPAPQVIINGRGKVTRETAFVTDDQGRIIGKHETETESD